MSEQQQGKIHILVALGTPPARPRERQISIEERVRSMLECIESGHYSAVEWLTIGKLYTALQKKKQTPRVRNLMSMIEPILNKYGYNGTAPGK